MRFKVFEFKRRSGGSEASVMRAVVSTYSMTGLEYNECRQLPQRGVQQSMEPVDKCCMLREEWIVGA